MNILLTNCAVKNGNRGCVALSVSVMSILKEILDSEGIPYIFILPQSGFDEVGEHTISIGEDVLNYKSVLDITAPSPFTKAKNLRHFSQYRESYCVYRDADCVLDIGVGDSFSDIYGLRRFNNIFASYKYGMRHNKPYCILPQTIGPFSDVNVRKQATKGIEYASCVMARDKQSYNYVKQILPNKEVSEVIDVAFFMPYIRKQFDPSYIHVGLNISALLWHGGYTMDNQFGLKVDYQKLVRRVISYFLSCDKVKLHLIPHVVGAERHIENDYAVSYDLYEEFQNRNLILAPLFLDPISAKGYIAGMDFFMGARMHSTIAAFSSGVPVAPMAYSRKFNGLFVDTLSYPDVADMKTSDEDEVLEVIKSCYESRVEKKTFIKGKMETVVADKKIIMFDKLRDFLSTNK